jgi:prevent-host-death family protein
MERVGVRELRRQASAILRRVASGETIQVTDRGGPVAMLVQVLPEGLERLEVEGMLRSGKGDLLGISPVAPRPGTQLPSELISQGRADRARSTWTARPS